MSTVGRERICVALDRATARDNISLIGALGARAAWYKVGMRQYYSPGADYVLAAVKESGARLFLDLKLHDIPKTVRDAAAALEPVEPDLLTVHASGGSAMVAAAADALADVGTGILGVTVLTSLDASDIAGLWGLEGADVQTIVAGMAARTIAAGARGVVCSAHEVVALRRELGPKPLLVTPGIRPAGQAAGDQKRVMTPGQAIAAGSSLLVVGRPIHAADDPVAAFEAIADEVVPA